MGEHTELRREVRATLMPGFVGFAPPAWLLDALGDGPAGGLLSACVYGGNVRDAGQLRALGTALRDAAPAALLAIDEEGGEVTRLHYLKGSPYPGAAVLGRIDDLRYTEEIGARVGRDVLAHGFNLALAPDADVNSNPDNPVIGTRSFGAEPALVSRHVAAWVRGLQGAGAVACPKHFPGHGDTAQDSHLELPVVDAPLSVLSERDLPPFAAAFASGARAVMTSHILLPDIDPAGPATFSETILHDVLRTGLGFTGVIVSDALDMRGASGASGIGEAAVRALRAGCDLLCLGTGTTAEQLSGIEDQMLSAVRAGRLSEARIREAAARVGDLAAASAPASAPPAETSVDIGEGGEAEIERIMQSFDGVAEARAWLAEHPRARVIRVEIGSNMAVGLVPWGPFAARSTPSVRDAARSFETRPLRVVDAETPLPWPRGKAGTDDAEGVIVIGRNLHRHAFARAGIDALRADGAPVLAVETGWPRSERRRGGDGYAELASYGSSAIVGAALLRLFDGGRS